MEDLVSLPHSLDDWQFQRLDSGSGHAQDRLLCVSNIARHQPSTREVGSTHSCLEKGPVPSTDGRSVLGWHNRGFPRRALLRLDGLFRPSTWHNSPFCPICRCRSVTSMVIGLASCRRYSAATPMTLQEDHGCNPRQRHGLPELLYSPPALLRPRSLLTRHTLDPTALF